MSYTTVIHEIQDLPRYRDYICSRCGYEQQIYSLTIQTICNQCDLQVKFRGYGSIGSEVEDVIDAVLSWLGQDKDFELAMARKRVIDSLT